MNLDKMLKTRFLYCTLKWHCLREYYYNIVIEITCLTGIKIKNKLRINLLQTCRNIWRRFLFTQTYRKNTLKILRNVIHHFIIFVVALTVRIS